MNKETFNNYLLNPRLLDSNSIQDLTELVNNFPYCQSANLLLTLNYYKEKHFRYDEALKRTAIGASNRRILRKHIEGMNKPLVATEEKDEPIRKEPVKSISKEKAKPIEKSETTVIQNDITGSKKKDVKQLVGELIDEFIKNEPSITRGKSVFFNAVEAAKTSVVDEESIVSETLAKIYYDQGQFEKAINIYQKLSLKFPEKSSYFAPLILKAEEELKK